MKRRDPGTAPNAARVAETHGARLPLDTLAAEKLLVELQEELEFAIVQRDERGREIEVLNEQKFELAEAKSKMDEQRFELVETKSKVDELDRANCELLDRVAQLEGEIADADKVHSSRTSELEGDNTHLRGRAAELEEALAAEHRGTAALQGAAAQALVTAQELVSRGTSPVPQLRRMASADSEGPSPDSDGSSVRGARPRGERQSGRAPPEAVPPTRKRNRFNLCFAQRAGGPQLEEGSDDEVSQPERQNRDASTSPLPQVVGERKQRQNPMHKAKRDQLQVENEVLRQKANELQHRLDLLDAASAQTLTDMEDTLISQMEQNTQKVIDDRLANCTCGAAARSAPTATDVQTVGAEPRSFVCEFGCKYEGTYENVAGAFSCGRVDPREACAHTRRNVQGSRYIC